LFSHLLNIAKRGEEFSGNPFALKLAGYDHPAKRSGTYRTIWKGQTGRDL
jgi:hypothetical protein